MRVHERKNLRRMENTVMLLTGGGGGIARGVARAFAREGADIILVDIRPEGMERTKKELEEEFGANVLCLVADGLKRNKSKRPLMRV